MKDKLLKKITVIGISLILFFSGNLFVKAATILFVPQGGTAADHFSPNAVIMSGASSNSALIASSTITIGGLYATSTATSSFAGGGLNVVTINATSTTATSTFSNGIQLSGGCFKTADGTCVVGGSGTINSGTTNRLSYYSGATTLDSANFLSVDVASSFLGISTSTPSSILSIQGAGNIVSTSGVTGNIATSTFYSNINTNNLRATSSLEVLSNAKVGGILTVVGDASLTGGATITCTGCLTDANVVDTITLTNITQITNRAISDTTGTLTVARGGTGLTTFGGTNTILYTSSADTLTSNSLFVFNGTNVGIGTTTPGTLLSIQGAASFSNNSISTIYGTSTIGNLVASSTFVLPFGSNPLVTLQGTMAWDTTLGQLVVATSSTGVGGAATDVIRTSPFRLSAFSVSSTTYPWRDGFLTGRTYPLATDAQPFTVTFIQCYLFGGTSIVLNLTDANGTNDTNTITCTTTSTSTRQTINTNNTWTAGEGISMESGTITGTPDLLHVDVFGFYTRQ